MTDVWQQNIMLLQSVVYRWDRGAQLMTYVMTSALPVSAASAHVHLLTTMTTHAAVKLLRLLLLHCRNTKLLLQTLDINSKCSCMTRFFRYSLGSLLIFNGHTPTFIS